MVPFFVAGAPEGVGEGREMPNRGIVLRDVPRLVWVGRR